MTKITIELDAGAVQSTSGVAGVTSQASQGPAVGTNPPADVLAQAAAIGAISGGAGPSSIGAAGTSAPIASSVGGTTAVSSHNVASGGAAPERVFGPQPPAP